MLMEANLSVENEIRMDYRTGNFVIMAPNRGKRPEDFAVIKERVVSDISKCPFEPGREFMSTEIMRIGDPWKIRVVQNQFPELIGTIPLMFSNGKLKKVSGYGYNEVIIDSPDHNKPFEALDDSQLKLWLDTVIEREIALYNRNYIKYVLVFKNAGEAAGESLTHPHTQVMAWPSIIGSIRDELKRIRKYKIRENKCIYEDILEEEKSRILLEDNNFIVIAPFGSRFPGESMILPRKHINFFAELDDVARLNLVKVLKQVLNINNKMFGNYAYNFVFKELKGYEEFHAHIDIYPRLTIQAGVELGNNVFVNQLLPEDYANKFRNILSSS